MSTAPWTASTPNAPPPGWPGSSTICPTGTCAAHGAGSGRATPAALATLHECLDTLTRMLAPLLPFVTDRVWQATVAATDPAAPDSVHLAPWPEDRPDLLDPDLTEQMALVRRVVEFGRTTRAESGVKIRQPLARGLVAAPGWDGFAPGLRAEIAAELNVLTLDPGHHLHRGARTGRPAPGIRPERRSDLPAAHCLTGSRADHRRLPSGR